MKKALILASMAVLALVSCEKKEFAGTEKQNEMSFVAMNANDIVTRGYTTGTAFKDIAYESLTIDSKSDETGINRTMQLSAYLYPQNGEQHNYFVNETFKNTGADNFWHAEPAKYWPVGGTLDFLAFSLSNSNSKNVTVAWDQTNAASKVVLGVPAENTQNDILFASKAGVESQTSADAVAMKFNHAQAWLQFQLTTNIENKVELKKIVLEKVNVAGDLTVSNNGGNAIAEWSFSEQPKDVAVDNYRTPAVAVLPTSADTPAVLDMLIPQQPKTDFVLYYTLGNSKTVLSYRFPSDSKTWLMGEKYVYKIKINTAEITVAPEVKQWNEIVSSPVIF